MSLKGVRFGLSAAVKRANEGATRSKRVFIDRKGICNYGRVQYLKDEEMIHKLSNSFYNRVKKLPQDYDMDAYMGFIRDWGTVRELNCYYYKKDISFHAKCSFLIRA